MMRPSQLSVICWIAASSIQTSGKGATVKTGRGSFQVRFAPGDGQVLALFSFPQAGLTDKMGVAVPRARRVLSVS